MINRRKHKRFIAKRGILVLFDSNLKELIRINKMSMGEMALAVLKSDYRQIGKMINLCLGGTALHYFDCNVRIEASSKVDILLAEKRIYISNMSFSMISKLEIDDEHSFNLSKMSKVSIQFKDITSVQLRQLEYLIKNHTLREA